MISFEHPSFLWGLTGLMIAVGIHLLSRKPARVVYAGSVRHLDGSSSRQFKSLALNEVLLLLLRILLLIIFCLIVGGPFLTTSAGGHRWLVIENGLERDPVIAKAVDSLNKRGYELRSLAKGFPELREGNATKVDGSYWALARALERQPIDDAVIFYRQRAEGFYGERSALPPHQRWIPVTSDSVFSYPVSAMHIADSVRIRIGKTSSRHTTFTTLMQPVRNSDRFLTIEKDSVAIAIRDTIKISLHADPAFKNDVRIFQAAFQVLEKMSMTKFVLLSDDRPKATDWTIWLTDHPISRQGHDAGIVFKDVPEGTLLTNIGAQQWVLNRHLTVADAIDQNFVVSLGRIMLPEGKYQMVIAEKDRRISQGNIWQAPTEGDGGKNDAQQKQSLVPVLLAMLLILLITERLMSWKRNQ